MTTIAVVGAVFGARASAVSAAPYDEIEDVELEPVSSSPCDDAIAQLDPQHEAKATCKKLEELAVPGLGTVKLERVVWSVAVSPGYSVVLSVQQPGDDTRWKVLSFSTGGCGAGTCVDYKPRSAHLVRLDPKGDPTFGVEIESLVEVSHTFKDTGPARSLPEHYRLACAARARVIDCKAIVIGGRGGDCRVLDWNGTAVRYTCTNETRLVLPRTDDTAGIPQMDVERVGMLAHHIDRVIAENQNDCADLVKQIDKLLQRDDESFALARSLNTPAGKLPHSLATRLSSPVKRLSGSHTCLENKPAQEALERLFHALGYESHFSLPAKP